MAKFPLLCWISILSCSFFWACGETKGNRAFSKPAEPLSSSGTPLFVVAGQSNAEGNVRLSGLQAIREALPSHNEVMSSAERALARLAYREGIGDWCNPDEDYSDEYADAAIDALRASGLDLSRVDSSYTVPGAMGAAYRWRFQEASMELGAPYQADGEGVHPAHTTNIIPFGIGFGVWDDEEISALFYGPELGFGLHIEQTQALDRFDLVKVAMGGSSLWEHWAPGGPMTQKLYEKTDEFLSARSESYLAGLIWFQGFNDQFEPAARDSYGANLIRLISDFREHYGENIPVVLIEPRKVGDLEAIANAQRSVTETMKRVAIVESDGLSDCFHYGASSQLIVGQRSAQAMLDLVNTP